MSWHSAMRVTGVLYVPVLFLLWAGEVKWGDLGFEFLIVGKAAPELWDRADNPIAI
jgi:hypothetical protein